MRASRRVKSRTLISDYTDALISIETCTVYTNTKQFTFIGPLKWTDFWKPPFTSYKSKKRTNQKLIREVKKGFLSFYSVCIFCIYICVCLCVCLSVDAIQTLSFNIGGWTFDMDTYIWISQNGIFYFFEILFIFGVIPLFRFLLFTLFQGCKSSDHENQYTKLKLGTSGIYYV